MTRKIQLILDAEKYSQMEYPKVHQPLKTIVPFGKVRYQAHIADSGSTGKFINHSLNSEMEAWEESVKIVADMKRNKKI